MVETRAKFNKREEQCKLEAMPPEVMEHILKHCDYFDIDALRKTCKTTRRLVGMINPAPKIKILKLNSKYGGIVMSLQFWDSTRKDVTFHFKRSGSVVLFKNRFRRNADRERFFKYGCPSEFVERDLKILLPMLAHQKSPLELFEAHFDGTSEFFQTAMEVLAGSRSQLRIENFSFDYRNRPDLMKILPLLCATTLKRLSIIERRYGQDEVLDLSQVAELAQWRSISNLSLIGSHPDTLTRLGQIRDSCASYKTVPIDQLVSLKEMLRNNPTFNECSLQIRRFSKRIQNEIKMAIAPRATSNRSWFFRTSTPEFVLKVTLLDGEDSVTFKRIPVDSLNGNAVQD